MGQLTPDPVQRTNQLLVLLLQHRADNETLQLDSLEDPDLPTSPIIAANILLVLSLCCSLLAAAGAMLGKQWLQSYDSAGGRSGPVDAQGRERQRKWEGSVTWYLRPILDLLPMLLLTSLLLFFAGLADYLWTLSFGVGFVVLVFAIISTNFFLFTIVAAAVYTQCPFQTGISFYLREWYLKFERLLEVRLLRRSGQWYAAADRELEEAYAETENAQSASWMLTTASEQRARLLATKNIPLLLRVEACRMLFFGQAYPRLFFYYRRACSKSVSGEKKDVNTLLLFTRAICHLVSTVPLSAALRRYSHQLPRPEWILSQSSAELKLLAFPFIPSDKIALQEEWAQNLSEQVAQVDPSSLMLLLKSVSSVNLSDSIKPAVILGISSMCRRLKVSSNQPFLSSVALTLASLYSRQIKMQIASRRISSSWEAYRG